jgi:hypothetical protein
MYDTTSKVALPRKVADRIAKGVAEEAPWDSLAPEDRAAPEPSGPASVITAEQAFAPLEGPGDVVGRHARRGDAVGVWEEGPAWEDDGYAVAE